jgi:hypothetical protein
VDLGHDPEKWQPVFGNDHALFSEKAMLHREIQTSQDLDHDPIQPPRIIMV